MHSRGGCLNSLAFRGTVISKCANPECPAVFRYLHEGKLFEFEVRSLDKLSIGAPSANHKKKPLREIECFWLCASCASTMTLIRGPSTHGVVIVPLRDTAEGRGDTGDTSTEEKTDQG